MIANLLSKPNTLKINSHAQLHESDLVLYLSFISELWKVMEYQISSQIVYFIE
jgi:protein gp37